MMSKLLVALVAMSLVAVAQPASAQQLTDCYWGMGNCPKIPDVKDQITIKSIDGQKVFATNGNSYPVPKPKEVSVDGLQVAPEALKPGMVCEVNRGVPQILPRNIFTCKTS
jgi:hypothetical protein